MNVAKNNYSHLKPVIMLFVALQLLLFAPRLNSDGAFYYEFVRSWVLQGDLNFHDEREFFTWEWIPVLDNFLPGDWDDTGYPPNIFSFGPAMIWMPLFVIGHWLVLLLNGLGASVSSTGYGAVHRFLPMLASPLAGLVTLFVIDRIGREAQFGPRDRAAALFVLLGASHLPAFLFVTPAFAHAYSVLFVSLFVLMWYYSACPEFTWKYHALFGLITGLAATARWQNLFCLILPLADIGHNLLSKRDWKTCKILMIRWSVFGLGMLLAVFPQLLVTRTLYGTWVTDPQGDGGMRWFNPQFRLILFDGIKGLFTVNPILLPAVFAVPFLWKRNKRLTWGLTFLVLSQSYINAVRRDWAGVGFGMRRFLNLSPAFAVGLMVVFALTSKPSRKWLRNTFWCIGALMIAWNLLLMGQYYYSRLGTPFVEMRTREMLQAQFTEAPALFLELIRTGLVFNGILGDYIGLILGVNAIVITLASFGYLKKNQRQWYSIMTGNPVILSVVLYLFIIIGWIGYTASAAKIYYVPNIRSPGYFASVEKLRIHPVSGFQGFRAGVLFGPGQYQRIVRFPAQYDVTRFLSSGKIVRVETDIPADDTVRWTFNEPVESMRMELVSGISPGANLLMNQTIGVVILVDIRDEHHRFPIRFGQHVGAADVIPRTGRLMTRRWPALNPIETEFQNTQASIEFGRTLLIRSVEIQSEGLPVKWFVRGIAFQAPDTQIVPVGNIN
jgi:hypothetical protein